MQIILNQEKENTSSLKMNGLRKSKINPSNYIVLRALI